MSRKLVSTYGVGFAPFSVDHRELKYSNKTELAAWPNFSGGTGGQVLWQSGIPFNVSRKYSAQWFWLIKGVSFDVTVNLTEDITSTYSPNNSSNTISESSTCTGVPQYPDSYDRHIDTLIPQARNYPSLDDYAYSRYRFSSPPGDTVGLDLAFFGFIHYPKFLTNLTKDHYLPTVYFATGVAPLTSYLRYDTIITKRRYFINTIGDPDLEQTSTDIKAVSLGTLKINDLECDLFGPGDYDYENVSEIAPSDPSQNYTDHHTFSGASTATITPNLWPS